MFVFVYAYCILQASNMAAAISILLQMGPHYTLIIYEKCKSFSYTNDRNHHLLYPIILELINFHLNLSICGSQSSQLSFCFHNHKNYITLRPCKLWILCSEIGGRLNSFLTQCILRHKLRFHKMWCFLPPGTHQVGTATQLTRFTELLNYI